jgi:hypothetical protein
VTTDGFFERFVGVNDEHDIEDCAGTFHFQDRLKFKFRMVLTVKLDEFLREENSSFSIHRHEDRSTV